MKAMDVVLEYLGEVAGGVGGKAGDEVSHLGKSADYNQDGVEVVGKGKINDVIHRDGRPWAIWDGEWLEWTVGTMSWRL